MFRSSIAKVRAWLAITDDLLGSPEDVSAPAVVATPGPSPHPHRRPLTYKPVRRRGAVPAPPAVCLSPVRPKAERRISDAAAR